MRIELKQFVGDPLNLGRIVLVLKQSARQAADSQRRERV
jgi:hypothetical protein